MKIVTLIPIEIEEAQSQRHDQDRTEGQASWVPKSGAEALPQSQHSAIVRMAYDSGRE